MKNKKLKNIILTIIISWLLILTIFVLKAYGIGQEETKSNDKYIYPIANEIKLKTEINALKYSLQEAREIKDLLSESNYIGEFTITHYTASLEECGKTNGITKSGTIVQDGQTIAADWNVLPVGTKVWIEGYGIRVVEDTGSAIRGNDIDIYVNTTHKEALKMGVKQAKVYILK